MRAKTVTVFLVIVALALTAVGCGRQSSDEDTAPVARTQSTKRNIEISPSVPSSETGGPATRGSSVITFESDPATIRPNKIVLFDNAHKELFTPYGTGQTGYSEMQAILNKYGYNVRMNTGPITDLVLKDVDAVVIAGPMADFTVQEIDALARFAELGGDILITTHISDTVEALAQRFGIQLSNAVIAQSHDTIENRPKWFITRNIADSPINNNVTSFAVLASWALRPRGEHAMVIISSEKDSWADLEADDIYRVGEPVGAYGLAAISSYGRGRVAFFGDDAVFTNRALSLASNRTLCENILKWFEGSKK